MSDREAHIELSNARGDLMSSEGLQTFKTAYPDIDALSENSRGWDCRYDQMSGGRFSGSLLYAQTETVQFSKVHWNRKTRFKGHGPADAYCFEFSLTPRSDPRRLNLTQITNNQLIFQPPNKPNEFLSGENRDSIVLALDRDYFLGIAMCLSGRESAPEDQTNILVNVSDNMITELRKICLQCAQIVRRHLETGGSEDVIVRAVDQVAKLVVWRFYEACKDGQQPVRVHQSASLVAKAQDLLDARENPATGLTEIAKSLGVSLRTLNYAFRDATGEPPARWLRANRLNSVRKKLLSEERTKTLVKQVAFDHGFLHLGRFSRQYRILFGELPTDTLAARVRSAPRSVCGAIPKAVSTKPRTKYLSDLQ